MSCPYCDQEFGGVTDMSRPRDRTKPRCSICPACHHIFVLMEGSDPETAQMDDPDVQAESAAILRRNGVETTFGECGHLLAVSGFPLSDVQSPHCGVDPSLN